MDICFTLCNLVYFDFCRAFDSGVPGILGVVDKIWIISSDKFTEFRI